MCLESFGLHKEWKALACGVLHNLAGSGLLGAASLPAHRLCLKSFGLHKEWKALACGVLQLYKRTSCVWKAACLGHGGL
eukprot:1154499-Pelagomonas_calceolata.AAC.3